MHIDALPAFQDNYIWMIDDGRKALVVDPGDAAPVLAACRARGLELAGILVTHHHADHCGGVAELRRSFSPRVWGPAAIDGVDQPLQGGESVHVDAPRLAFEVLAVPGHTLDHLAYFAPAAGLLFCGDALFSAGCGRLFEGTFEQLHNSLQTLREIPGETAIYCAHEYTLSNLQFAQALEPGRPQLIAYHAWCAQRRAAGLPTLPSTIAQQREINPFLRLDDAGVLDALQQRLGRRPADSVEALTALRQWKDVF